MVFDLTVIGDVNIDLITKIKKFPEKDRQVVGYCDLRIGGCAANFSLACKSLGLNVRLICKVGEDLFKNFILNALNSDNLNVKYTSGKRNGLTQAFSFEDGKRSFITYQGTNSEFTFNDIDLEDIKGKYVHVASFFLTGLKDKTKEIFKHCRKKGIKTSFDTGWDPFGWKNIPSVLDVLKYTDIFFPNMDEAKKITGKKEVNKILDFLLDYVKIVALKNGSKGCYIANSDETYYIKPLKVKVLDSVGAGDFFDAAFLYAILNGMDLHNAGEFANAAGAIKCSGRNLSIKEINKLMV